MKALAHAFLLGFVILVAGCASKPLTHDYQGKINIRTLQVEFAPIRDPEQNLSGDYAQLTKAIKGVQEILDVFDPAQRNELTEQLHTFESTLVDGIRQRAELPLNPVTESDVSMQYGDNNELVSVEYDYPLVDGAYLNLFVTIYYTERSDLTVGAQEFNANFIELRPEIILQIDGYNEKGDLFWRQTSRYESDVMYTFGDQYILGVPTKRLKEAQIFLIPMAKSVTDNLQILSETK
ncbi:hypothetical protein CWB99_22085 [Pseudoalteromonas rubra]|uniref:DUF3298 domain-containing protein n=1 Tax=Pseudoalteromonas rubra TaxID=43658 RepID=A0A5S3WFA8_9GAMM|nr:hypothetical protein [Pseudoalteromonas rubra]TMP24435.1 hypothetical protein CWB99_22085 [Pseudoalteromonas rubra]TMP33324.1 hypothetical protein CWC00_11155 [Pseudoalteromonas rubra]